MLPIPAPSFDLTQVTDFVSEAGSAVASRPVPYGLPDMPIESGMAYNAAGG